MDLPERLKPPLSAQDRSDLVVDAIRHGHEPPRVEVGRLSESQKKIDELFEARRREARQTEIKEQAKERRRYVLAQERRDSTRRQAGERPPAGWQEPRPNELGPAVLGEEYSGPPVPPPEELTPEQKKALAERKRLRKQERQEAAKRDQQRS